MPDVTNEMLYRAALELKAQTESLLGDIGDCGAQIEVMKGHLIATHCDIGSIYAVLVRHDAKLTRIERRLGIGEMTA